MREGKEEKWGRRVRKEKKRTGKETREGTGREMLREERREREWREELGMEREAVKYFVKERD